jgi:mycofactocin system glycosyltransferase
VSGTPADRLGAGPVSGTPAGRRGPGPVSGTPADRLGAGPVSGTPAGLPLGFSVVVDPDTRQLGPDLLFGGSPARLLRLNAAGARALAELQAGPIRTAAGRALGRRLTDGNLAHPVPPPLDLPGAGGVSGAAGSVAAVDADGAHGLDVTIVIPVLDRPLELERCLQALGSAYPVLVIDDGSADPARTAAICAGHGAEVRHRPRTAGPGPARNAALAEVRTELVAFLDSDCVPPPGWIAALAAHCSDPLVAAVAPRMVGTSVGTSTAAKYTAARSPLDLGPRPAAVRPLTRVSYVPTAALLVRRAAVGDGFDEALRYGEDVDLVWRLIDDGWRVRYEPSVRVAHGEPESGGRLLRRRFAYGTSAAPLARRHPGALAPLVLQPWPALTVAALLGRRPLLAAAGYLTGTALLVRRLRRARLPGHGIVRPTLEGVRQTWLGTGRWSWQFLGPALLGLLLRPGGSRGRTRLGRRAAVASLIVGPAITQWAEQRPPLDPVRWALASLADEASYGAGVWRGCLTERTLAPVLPRLTFNLIAPGRRYRPAVGPAAHPSAAHPSAAQARPPHV